MDHEIALKPKPTGKSARKWKHGEGTKYGYTTEFTIWNQIKARCYSPSCPAYKNYGARGITMCDKWRNDYLAFLFDVGRRPSKELTLDRIDNNGNYEPGNVRWATRSEQIRNSRKARYLTLNGETKTIGDWATELGINRRTIQMRIDAYGWTVDDALTKPVHKRASCLP